MTRRRKKTSRQHVDWVRILTSPFLQQILALILVAVGVILLLALFQITTGRWVEAWIGVLRFTLGWGSYQAAVLVLLTGLLWLGHHLDRPVKWRWRPFVGAELVFFDLLALTHTVVGGEDPWALVETGWGGGVVGWAISSVLLPPLGPLWTILLLSGVLVAGLGLAFDLTSADVAEFVMRAIREKRFWILTHPDWKRVMRERIDAMIENDLLVTGFGG